MLVFSSKARTLEALSKRLRSAKILPQIRISAYNWDKLQLKEQVCRNGWLDQSLIVRSSTQQEDTHRGSLAGHFLTIPSVKSLDHLYKAVEQVISSYQTVSQQDEVLIQPMLKSVILSGVAFSCDPNTGTPYRVINYDDRSGKTDSVTSGVSNALKVYYAHHSMKVGHGEPADSIIRMIDELEGYFGGLPLDIEFAVTEDKEIFLLQVRLLIISEKVIALREHEILLKNVESSIEKLSIENEFLYGKKAIFGVMPDWNPAEIIGIRPRPLALSLYKEIITDKIWAYQRQNYGYRNLTKFPLLVDFYGLPYIDVRVSFNSFIPEDLDQSLAAKLLEYYLATLKAQPHLHDKVEFDIVYSSYTLDLNERLIRLRNTGFSNKEIEQLTNSLRSLTNRVLDLENGPFALDVKSLDDKKVLSNTIPELLEECKNNGTFPFAGIARAAFIAIQLLNSLVQKKILSLNQKNAFLASIRGICSQVREDLGWLNKEGFLNLYGHLREGTYDIRSLRYDEEPDRFFNFTTQLLTNKKQSSFYLSPGQLKQIDRELRRQGLNCNARSLFLFVQTAIESRERSKFLFSKPLSKILSTIKQQGQQLGFSDEECSFLDIQDLKKILIVDSEAKSLYRESILKGKKTYASARKLLLPPLIVSSKDVWSFCIEQSEPNFITLGKADGDVCLLQAYKGGITSKVVFIESADPGYDWIFTHGIAALVTLYGGVNSHMAIRSMELDIPAVIGAGEIFYRRWSKAKKVKIDCENRRVEILR